MCRERDNKDKDESKKGLNQIVNERDIQIKEKIFNH